MNDSFPLMNKICQNHFIKWQILSIGYKKFYSWVNMVRFITDHHAIQQRNSNLGMGACEESNSHVMWIHWAYIQLIPVRWKCVVCKKCPQDVTLKKKKKKRGGGKHIRQNCKVSSWLLWTASERFWTKFKLQNHLVHEWYGVMF